MELIVALLIPFPIGFFLRQRLAAYVAYTAVHAFAFTFQTLVLLRAWIGGSDEAFSRDPNVVPWDYALVNGVIYAAGIGLVTLGHRVARRRRQRAEGRPVDLTAAR